MRWAFLLACLTQVAGQRTAVSFVGNFPYSVPVNGTLELEWEFQSDFPPQVHLTLSRDSTIYVSLFLNTTGVRGSYLLDTAEFLLQPMNHSITIHNAANFTDIDGNDTQTVIVTARAISPTLGPTSSPISPFPTPLPSLRPSKHPSHAPTLKTDTKSEGASWGGSQVLEVTLASSFTILVFCCAYQIINRYNSRRHMAKATKQEQQFYVALFDSSSVNGSVNGPS